MRGATIRGAVVAAVVTCAAACSVFNASDDPSGNGVNGSDNEPTHASTVGSVDHTVLALRYAKGAPALEIGLTATGAPAYRVVLDQQTVVGWSRLGVELTVDGSAVGMADGLRAGAISEPTTVEDTFDLPTGKARTSSTVAQVQSVRFERSALPGETTTSELVLQIEVWASSHAVAFRSHVISAAETELQLDWERTSFTMPRSARSWLQPYDPPGPFTPAYEQLYRASTPAAQPISAGHGWSLPALFEHNGIWTLLAEAGARTGQAGSHLGQSNADGQFVLILPDPDEGQGVGSRHPVATPIDGRAQLTTPWRTFLVADELRHIVASNTVRHLADEGSPTSTPDWVQPGRVSWSWWSDHASSTDATRMRDFVDLAAEFGWEYSLIDANWNEIPDQELTALIDHAAARGVGLFFWHNSGGPNNAVTEAPRDLMHEPAVRRAQFARLAALGAAGVKVDFFHSDKPVSFALYRDIFADALEAGLMVNVHGSTVPRGWSRTFPNLMTMESVRGAEIYTFDRGYEAAAPRHNVTLAFTRNVVGSMDYTPVILGDLWPRRTTNAHELALAVVFESGLVHFADTPEVYRSQPAVVQRFLRDVPAAWDETRLIAGDPDTHAVVARRFETQWFVGAINGEDQPRTVELPRDSPMSGRSSATTSTTRLAAGCRPRWRGARPSS